MNTVRYFLICLYIYLCIQQQGEPSQGANPSPSTQVDLDKCLPSIRGPYGSSNAGGWSKGYSPTVNFFVFWQIHELLFL